MTTTAVENIPEIWNDARDIPFFRITAPLCTPEFCLSASVLLASYDDTDTAQFAPAEPSTSTPASAETHTQPARDLIPIRVRRTR
jgi:hypothetical protein